MCIQSTDFAKSQFVLQFVEVMSDTQEEERAVHAEEKVHRRMKQSSNCKVSLSNRKPIAEYSPMPLVKLLQMGDLRL